MTDNHTPDQRSRNMAHIRSKNTSPEIIVRRYLFSKGLRYRLYDKSLPGKPDIILPKFKTVVFVNGCFWHSHPGCCYAATPKSNEEYWHDKLRRNVERDHIAYESLESNGWRVIVVWECQLRKNAAAATLNALFDRICTI